MVKYNSRVLDDIQKRKHRKIDVMEEISRLSDENKESLRNFERDYINRDVQLDGTINKVNGVLKSLYLDLGDFEILCRASQVEEMLVEMKDHCPEVVRTIRHSL